MKKCPICGKNHRMKAEANKCFNDVRREREHYIIAYSDDVPKKLEENYESNKRLYHKMKEYMKKFTFTLN